MSVYRPKKKNGAPASPFFHFDFELGGRRFYGSTRTATRRAALEVERKERLAARSVGDDTTINGAFGRFWSEVGQHDSDSDTTFKRLAVLQDGLTAILRETGRAPTIGSVTENELAIYVARRRLTKTRHGGERAPATINRELQLLRRVMRRAVTTWKHQIVLPDWKAVLLVEPEEHVVDIPPAIEDLIAAEMRADFRPALRFLVMTGLRRGSVLAGRRCHGPLKAEAVDFESAILTVKMKSRKPGGRTLRLPITRPMKILLGDAISKAGPGATAVFTYRAQATRDGRRHGHRYPLAATVFYSDFKRACVKIGYPALRVHDLRHTAGNRTLAATGNLRLTQKLLGHTRISTTQLYTHPDVEALRVALEEVHQRQNPETGPETTASADGKKAGARRP